MASRFVVVFLIAAGCAHGPVAPGVAVARLRVEAQAGAKSGVCDGKLARAFLAATAQLPEIAPRTLWRDAKRRRWATQAGPELQKQIVDEEYYYNTRYGTPLAYCRAFEVSGLDGLDGLRLLDFGYGGIGPLRLNATLGADAVGVDVDPSLPIVYSWPGDTGAVGRGRVTLVDGHFPTDTRVAAAVGSGYDVVISKNTLKEGYVHPKKPDPRYDIGVDDESFVRALRALLKPGGRLVIYNIAPAANAPGKPYRSWADAPLPFPRALLEKAGFRVVAYDVDDGPALRKLAHALEWDKGDEPTDIEHDLFARYTVAVAE
jgi:hypothetical protein